MTDSVDFEEVFREELSWIDKSREVLPREGSFVSPAQSAPGAATSLANLESEALKRNLCGLALSGGGIRSATFGLGVLQGLASIGLLRKFDYLSTVSGGGYIGSWYSAWVNRCGYRAAEAGLLPASMRTATDSENSTERIEKPIRHLRLYSNYLAPRPGFFSFDGWVLIAIGLRNLILNQLVLLSAVLGLFLALRFITELFAMAHQSSWSQLSHVGYGIAALAEFLVVIWGTAYFVPVRIAPSNRDDDKSKLRKPEKEPICVDESKEIRPGDAANSSARQAGPRRTLALYWASCVVPWILIAVFSALGIVSPHFLAAWRASQLNWTLFGECILAFVIIHVTIGGTSLRCGLKTILTASVCSGLIGGAVFFISWRLLLLAAQGSTADNDITVATVATFGIPLSMLVVVLTGFLMIGFCGIRLKELEREWWSSLNSRLIMVAFCWAVLGGASVFGPWLLMNSIGYDGSYGKALSASIATGWIGVLATGLKAAQGSQTFASSRRGIREKLATAAPALFLVTLLLAMALASTWVFYESHANLNEMPEWRFHERVALLLSDLNGTKGIHLYGHVSQPLDQSWLPRVLFEVTSEGSKSSVSIRAWPVLLFSAGAMIFISWLVGRSVGVNTFSLQSLYTNRLVRCYLGATNLDRKPSLIVNMDPADDFPVSHLYPGVGFQQRIRRDFKRTDAIPLEMVDYIGPLHLINGAMNQKASVDSKSDGVTEVAENLQFLERKAESFTFSPLYCGSESTGYIRSNAFEKDIAIGTAVAVSGAAVSPNMGYHSSPAITALLTAFNIRLGAWFRNPRHSNTESKSNPPGMGLFFKELAGLTNSRSDYVYVSDGGHFENVGIYELVRRRCRFIVAVDTGADPTFQENFGRVVRQVRIDFGIRIDIDMKPVTPDANGRCAGHMVVGRIHYEDAIADYSKANEKRHHSGRLGDLGLGESQGVIVWIKNGLTGDEPVDVLNYVAMHPSFPYDTTLDQFFNESQFESYRALGWHSVTSSLNPFGVDWSTTKTCENFKNLYDFFLQKPPGFVPVYVGDNEAYANIQKALHQNPHLNKLVDELYSNPAGTPIAERTEEEERAERLIAIEMYTLLENVWLSLDLDHAWNQPMYQGWMTVFERWKKSVQLSKWWKEIKPEFSPAFCRFIEHNVGGGTSTHSDRAARPM